jgi:hypothetical protein
MVMKKEYLLLLFLSSIALLLTILRIWLISINYVNSRSYVTVENKTHTLHLQNMELHDELLYDSALTTINQKAQKMGFVPAILFSL